MSQEAENAEPVAVVGMSCRFAPDLDSLDKLWRFLSEGRSAVGEMPAKRWEPYAASSPRATAILRGTTRLGSFMDDIEGFDADFFGISPREAEYLDPQQRVVLELAWEALAHAGIPPLSLRGTRASVFVSANSNDYGRRLLEDIAHTGAYAVNGTTYYGIANRISYFLDLRGPSMAVDTACAGSLTALHVACQSLRSGETPVAIVGGVNIIATPALFVALDAAGATAPDGRSKAFDAAADGYGRGEGAGVIVLKKLSDAQRDGDPILAVVRGSGVYQDGRSDGMMAPNGDAQEYMLRHIYADAGIEPGTVGYVEAHGTGTPVGDREEAQALAAVFGAGRSADDPCLIGSLKPNIGHVEAGSGIAGVIKSVLSLQRGQIPPSVHTEPNPEFDWQTSGLRLIAELEDWPTGQGPRRAGVSSYGVGGTTAHVILEEAPVAQFAGNSTTAATDCAPSVFPLSGMSDAGLRGLAAALADHLDENPDTQLAAVGHTLASRRSHLAQRGAVVARTTAELTNGLRALAEDRRLPGVVKARAVTGQGDGVVWVFSGHGAQWSGMGRELLRTEPAFAVTIDALEDVFRDEMGWSAREALERGGPWTAADSQALTFAVQAGLAALWTARGVAPAAIIGHSVGEIAAAVAAGCLDLRQAARFACRRANALRQLEGAGAMAMVALPFAQVEELLRGEDDAVAAISASTRSTVVSGGADAIERLAARWAADGLDVRRVDTDIAFHSARIDAVLAPIIAAANELDPCAAGAQVPLYTTALADPRSKAPRDGGYWAANVRQPVRFAQAVEAAVADGFRLFLEISAHPVVTHSIAEVLDHLGAEDGIAVGTLRRDTPEAQTVAANLALLHCHGAAVDWTAQHPDGGLADLPAMAWQHKPYWIFPDGGADTGTGGGHDPERHSLLGGRMTVSGAPARQVWQTHLDMSCRPYPQSHEVVGVEITPAAAIINTFILAAARGGRAPGLSDIVLRTPLAVVPPRVVQVVLAENTVRLASRVAEGSDGSGEDEHEWITHTTATIEPGRALAEATVDPAAIRPRCDDEWDWDRVDGLFRTKGVGGYAFPWDLEELRTNGAEQLSILTLEPAPARCSSSWAHVIDGALTISAVLVTPEDARRLWMSSHMDSVVFRGEPPARITVHTVRSPQSPVDTVDVQVADEDGAVVCEVMGLRFAALQDQLGPIAAPRDLVHEVTWRPFELPVSATTAQQSTVSAAELPDSVLPHTVLLGEVADTNRLAVQFEAEGVRCSLVSNPDELRDVTLPNPGIVLVVPSAGPAGEGPEDAADRNAWTLIRAAQALAEARKVAWEEAAPDVRLWCLTEGVRGAGAESALGQAPLWGVARIIAGEHPELWGGLVDVTPASDPYGVTEPLAARLIPLLRHAAGQEDVISLDGGQTSVARLARIERTPDGTPVQCRPSGTYLITGGLGALGLLVARWLVDRGASRFLLASRRGLPPRAQWAAVRDAQTRAQIDGVLALEALGVTVKVLALDITDAEQVAAALDPAAHGLPPVRGIVHAAGVVRDAMLDKVDRDGLSAVLGPKAAGAMVLHRLFPPGSLDFFVMFSSCGQFARLTGQTSYAAANSFLDALAEHRRSGGHTDTVSLAWTAWRGIGMSETITGTMMEANARGLDAVSPAEAFRAWAFAERYASPYQAVLRVLPLPAGAPKPPMLRELTAAEADPAAADGAGTTVCLDWAGTPEAELREFVTADVREQVAAELYQPAEDVDLRRPLVELGFDSVLTVALRVRLNRRYGVDLPPTILWNKPTVSALAGHLADTLRPNNEV